MPLSVPSLVFEIKHFFKTLYFSSWKDGWHN